MKEVNWMKNYNCIKKIRYWIDFIVILFPWEAFMYTFSISTDNCVTPLLWFYDNITT